MDGRLQGRVAVVTGSGGAGIGRAIALRLAREGAQVIGCDLNATGALETVRQVEAAGGRMVSVQPVDLGDDAAVERLMATAAELGGIDILVNSAVSARFGRALAQSRRDFEDTLAGCVTAPWMAIRQAAPRLRPGGAIVNIASMAGLPGGTGALGNCDAYFTYALSKAAVVKMTQLLAIELAPSAVRVNAISPGITLPTAAALVGEEGSPTHEAWTRALLVRRPGRGEDVAAAAAFLASDEAAYITGHNLVVDGGWHVAGGLGWPDPQARELLNAPAGWLAAGPRT